MLSPVQRAMIAVLRHGQTIPTDRLVTVVYSGTHGGPDDAAHAIRAQMCKIRDKLERYGIEIETIGRGRGAIGYRVNPRHRRALDDLLDQFGDVMVM